MAVLENLEPKKVFHYFEEISQIPRPSYHEEAISNYLVKFAEEHGFEHYQDDAKNVIIIKEASEGYEDAEPIILQGHMDMVCETAPDCTKDMMTEGLDLAVDGDYIYAKGTTLGGDDGIAVAYALAILDDDSLAHPRLEFICTTCEEVGMDGAFAVDPSCCKGHKLLNMDSENEGVVLASCAGGGNALIELPVERAAGEGITLQVSVEGLCGGHSGVEIHKGRANAVLVMARYLAELNKNTEVRITTLEGGTKFNAIPRSAKAVITIPADAKELAVNTAEEVTAQLRNELAVADPQAAVVVSDVDVVDNLPLIQESTKKVIGILMSVPNGVVRMSNDIEGLVETSLNLGITSMDEKSLHLHYSLRSSVGTAFSALETQIAVIAEAYGASAEFTGQYPAWPYVRESALRDTMSEIYKDMFGKELKIEAIHAGVECGLLAGKIENLDAISMGPDILDIHTPQERLSVSSVQRMYDFILRIIAHK